MVRLLVSTLAVAATAAEAGTANPERVTAIAAQLPVNPVGFGVSADNRALWQALAREKAFQEVVAEATKMLAEPIPPLPDELYLDFSRTGNRDRWQKVAQLRTRRLVCFAMAECLQDKGRFISAYEDAVRALCDEPTWVMPAHDGSLANFKGTEITIDLRSSKLAQELATADFLLGKRLRPQVRELIREHVQRRVLTPYLDMVTGQRKSNFWVTGTNNWNAVCHAGVVGAALWLVEPRQGRALFIAAAEKNIEHFLNGFGQDGYCSEGVGYWNYGFGNFLLLAEMVHQATRGRIDFLAGDRVRPAALYGANIEIIGGICPSFADCPVGSQPAPMLMWFVNRRFGLNASRWEQVDLRVPQRDLAYSMMFLFPNSASRLPPPDGRDSDTPPRQFFESSGIVLCRPGDHAHCRLGAGFKGGHNAEHHNHNDVGSYVVVLGKQMLLADIGAEVYTARTFSPKRYDSQALNSYGHPVPIVAGQLQRTGARARGQLLRTHFTDAIDTVAMDLRSAYDVPEITQLQRTFVYSREKTGSFTVTDEVAFAAPKPFGTALVTLSRWEQTGPNIFRLYEDDEAIRVEIKATGSPFSIVPERIEGNLRTRKTATRLGINLKHPVTEATITVTVTPAG